MKLIIIIIIIIIITEDACFTCTNAGVNISFYIPDGGFSWVYL